LYLVNISEFNAWIRSHPVSCNLPKQNTKCPNIRLGGKPKKEWKIFLNIETVVKQKFRQNGNISKLSKF